MLSMSKNFIGHFRGASMSARDSFLAGFLMAIFGVVQLGLGQRPLAEQTLLAATPPMGWNSWDSYGLTINESEFKANASWLARNLKAYGWRYVVVDEGWYLANPASKGKPAWQFTMDEHGRYQPAPNRFPSTVPNRGFKPVADSVHALGLKFGIHIIRGIPREAVAKNLPIDGSPYHAAEAADISDRCAWNPDNYGVKATAAGQAYYDSLARMYASWGVDFVKVDCISSPYKTEEVKMVSLALKKSGRPIVLSLSPGPTPLEEASEVRKYAEQWRISGDVWDHWGPWPGRGWSQGLLGQFTTAAQWAPYVEAGHWPDADMLPIGRLGPRPGEGVDRPTQFTKDEQRTMMTLWSIFRSPLMMGGDLPSNDAWTTSLLTNREMIAVDQHSRGGHPVLTSAKTAVWLAEDVSGKELQPKAHYVAVFNLADIPQTIHYSWQELKLEEGNSSVRDLWEHKDLGSTEGLNLTLAPHASALYLVTAAK
jgi:alpha-galactosidase